MSNLPKFAPEGSYDQSEAQEYCSKSLYEQLQEQKNIKLKKFEEENSFKNSVKMYDEDDFTFINEVRQSKLLKEMERANEVKLLVETAKKREAELLVNPVNIYENLDEKIQLLRGSNVENDRMSKLKAMLKRKRSEEADQCSASKMSKPDGSSAAMDTSVDGATGDGDAGAHEGAAAPDDVANCLPGMEAYGSDVDDDNNSHSDSDSSDTSSDSEVDVGTLRPLIKRLNDKIKKNCQ